MKRIRLLIADDHVLVRAGIRALVERQANMEVVAEASNGREALVLARDHKPQVVLMDISMPELNGLEAIRQLAKELPDTQCLVLSMHADEEHVWHALQAGAAGYLVKGGSLAELELAINSVALGETYLSPSISRHVITQYIDRTTVEHTVEALTPRQREILQLIAEGKNTKQIAMILDVSVKTVESHRAQLMKRLGTADIANLVRHAIRLKLVNL
ncbi:MAG: response regulator transcription factor [Acidobacteriota bacterium]|nr:response regulator transcription factor [Acidobacteriota bacterium]